MLLSKICFYPEPWGNDSQFDLRMFLLLVNGWGNHQHLGKISIVSFLPIFLPYTPWLFRMFINIYIYTYIYIYIYKPWIPKAVIFGVFPVKTQDQCLVRMFN